MENKQTAVEWLMYNLPSLFVNDSGHYKELFDRAKAMERGQIAEAFNAGQASTATEPFWTKGNYYYEQKYGKINAPISEAIDQTELPEGEN